MSTVLPHRWTCRIVLMIACALAPRAAQSQTTETITIRGHAQSLRLYGTRGGPPVIVSSGDGGWIHLGPHVAETSSRPRVSSSSASTSRPISRASRPASVTLRPEDEPGDYKALADFAARGTTQKPILIGVSEGAGLSVLAATDPQTKRSIAGVLGLGLPDLNELGWRWKDSLIYVTHGVPKEPTFSAAAIVDRVAPTPARRDPFDPGRVRAAVGQSSRVFDAAKEPKKLWIVKASDHRFSDNLAEFDRRLLEAIAWITPERRALRSPGVRAAASGDPGRHRSRAVPRRARGASRRAARRQLA